MEVWYTWNKGTPYCSCMMHFILEQDSFKLLPVWAMNWIFMWGTTCGWGTGCHLWRSALMTSARYCINVNVCVCVGGWRYCMWRGSVVGWQLPGVEVRFVHDPMQLLSAGFSLNELTCVWWSVVITNIMQLIFATMLLKIKIFSMHWIKIASDVFFLKLLYCICK